MLEWDELAQLPSHEHGMSLRERERRFGMQPVLVLTGLGANTHDIREAPNYQQMLEQGPQERPPSPKAKGKGRNRRRTSQQSDQWHHSSWKHRRY